MGRIKEYTSKFHMGVMEGSTLIMMVLILFISYSEASMMTQNEWMLRGLKTIPGFFDNLRNAAIPFISTLCMMLIPVALREAKKPNSSGGSKIDKWEASYVSVLIIIGVTMVMFTYNMLSKSFEEAAIVTKMTDQAKDYFLYKIKYTIAANMLIDFLVGFATIMEITKHNKAVNSSNSSKTSTTNTRTNSNGNSTGTTTLPSVPPKKVYEITLSRGNASNSDLVKLSQDTGARDILKLISSDLHALENKDAQFNIELELDDIGKNVYNSKARLFNLDCKIVPK